MTEGVQKGGGADVGGSHHKFFSSGRDVGMLEILLKLMSVLDSSPYSLMADHEIRVSRRMALLHTCCGGCEEPFDRMPRDRGPVLLPSLSRSHHSF